MFSSSESATSHSLFTSAVAVSQGLSTTKAVSPTRAPHAPRSPRTHAHADPTPFDLGETGRPQRRRRRRRLNLRRRHPPAYLPHPTLTPTCPTQPSPSNPPCPACARPCVAPPPPLPPPPMQEGGRVVTRTRTTVPAATSTWREVRRRSLIRRQAFNNTLRLALERL